MLARLRKKVEDTEGGFTLIELLVVIIIIGILAAIAIPVFLNQRQKGYDAAAKSDARNLATLEETFLTDNSTYRTAPDIATAASALGYKASANVSSVVVKTYTSASPRVAGAAGSEGNGSFCITTVSASPKTFIYDSSAGGFTTVACP
mgnify:CR=1 FL=1